MNVQISGLNYARPLQGGASSRPEYRKPEECEKTSYNYFVKITTPKFSNASKTKKIRTNRKSCRVKAWRYGNNQKDENTSSTTPTPTPTWPALGQIRNFLNLALTMFVKLQSNVSQLGIIVRSKFSPTYTEIRKITYQLIRTTLYSCLIVLIYNVYCNLNLQINEKTVNCKTSSVIKIKLYPDPSHDPVMLKINKNIFTLTTYFYFIIITFDWFYKLVTIVVFSNKKINKEVNEVG